MVRFATRRITVQLCVAVLLVSPLVAQTDEAAARQLLETGRAALAAGKGPAATTAFDTIVTKYPRTSQADEALLERARYQLDVLRDDKAAAGSVDQLLADYAASNSAPRSGNSRSAWKCPQAPSGSRAE